MDFEHPENVTEAEGEDIDEKPEAEQNRTALQPRIPTYQKNEEMFHQIKILLKLPR